MVDNTPGDSETERITTHAGARYLVESRVGLSNARNAGIDAANGELIAFIDDDAIADPAWLSQHSEALADTSLMGSTGRILPMSARNGQASDAARALDLGDQAFVVDRSDPWWFERANFGGVGAGGSNMVLKRRAFEHGLRFRETLGLGADLGGFEEHYLFFTMIKSGSRVAYVPGAVVRHRGVELSADPETHRTARAHCYSAAYLTMLLVEEPEFRPRTLRYIVRVLRRGRNPWRPPSPNGHRASGLNMLAAGYRGPLLYLRSRLTKR